MSFEVGIVSLGGTVFFQVGFYTPLQTMGPLIIIFSVGFYLKVYFSRG